MQIGWFDMIYSISHHKSFNRWLKSRLSHIIQNKTFAITIILIYMWSNSRPNQIVLDQIAFPIESNWNKFIYRHENQGICCTIAIFWGQFLEQLQIIIIMKLVDIAVVSIAANQSNLILSHEFIVWFWRAVWIFRII